MNKNKEELLVKYLTKEHGAEKVNEVFDNCIIYSFFPKEEDDDIIEVLDISIYPFAYGSHLFNSNKINENFEIISTMFGELSRKGSIGSLKNCISQLLFKNITLLDLKSAYKNLNDEYWGDKKDLVKLLLLGKAAGLCNITPNATGFYIKLYDSRQKVEGYPIRKRESGKLLLNKESDFSISYCLDTVNKIDKSIKELFDIIVSWFASNNNLAFYYKFTDEINANITSLIVELEKGNLKEMDMMKEKERSDLDG